jgi:hypothetical protein
MLISRLVDHVPLYRQLQQLRHDKVEIAESTMGGLVKACGERPLPLYEMQRALIQQSSYVRLDETLIPVLDQTKPGKTHLGYHWVYCAVVAKLVWFEYRLSRSRARLNAVPKIFTVTYNAMAIPAMRMSCHGCVLWTCVAWHMRGVILNKRRTVIASVPSGCF